MDWFRGLADAPAWVPLLVAGIGAFALYNGFAGLRRVRRIEDVPTARVRSAPQAYVELEGVARALDGEPVIAPLSQTVCCWYRFKVEERSGQDWRVSRSGNSDGLFLLRDATGDCVIDPEGAEVTTLHIAKWFDDGDGWGGHGVHKRHESLGALSDAAIRASGFLFDGVGQGRYRYTEAVILDGDPLYAIGQFRSHDADAQGASLRELTGAILREWKQRPDTLRERFDRDRNGLIDQEEWERARALAEQQARREQAEQQAAEPVHTLVKPGGGRFFLLSNLAEFGLLSRYRWRMRLGFLGFLLCAGVLPLLVVGRW